MNPFLKAAAQERLVLASRSPRRFDILTGLGFEFDVEPAASEVERATHEDPYALPELLAQRKRDDVARRRPADTVIGADTVVILDRRILTKPTDDANAHALLRALSGRTHTVVTGVAVRRAGVAVSGSARTNVTFRTLTDEDIVRYVATGEGRDKAGSYGAQGLGAALVQSIDGCFYNVVGLPVTLLLDLLGSMT